MHHPKLVFMLVIVLAGLAAGCGSAPVRMEPAPVDARQQIIDEHNTMAAQKIGTLQTQHQTDTENALADLRVQETAAIGDIETHLKQNLDEGKAEAEATLSDQELVDRLKQLEDEYSSKLAEETQKTKGGFADKIEQAKANLAPSQQRELNDLEASLAAELQDKLDKYDREQERLAAEAAAQVTEQQAAEQAQQAQAADEQTAARPAPVFQTEAPAGPAPGTKAPVKPVVVHTPPPTMAKGLRREGDAPLGQRRYYVNKYFRSGEALATIQPSEELEKRERHEMIITYWMEGTPEKAIPRFMLNGLVVNSWQELEMGVGSFRSGLIAEHYILYPKVILDQRRDVPRSVTDDILSVCFKVGIRHISMVSREPLMEQ